MAKYWAAEGGQRVVHAASHLHGGVGVDRDYPLHRYFLLTEQIELTLGGAGTACAGWARSWPTSRSDRRGDASGTGRRQAESVAGQEQARFGVARVAIGQAVERRPSGCGA